MQIKGCFCLSLGQHLFLLFLSRQQLFYFPIRQLYFHLTIDDNGFFFIPFQTTAVTFIKKIAVIIFSQTSAVFLIIFPQAAVIFYFCSDNDRSLFLLRKRLYFYVISDKNWLCDIWLCLRYLILSSRFLVVRPRYF